jgi:hypothetical protein
MLAACALALVGLIDRSNQADSRNQRQSDTPRAIRPWALRSPV